MNETVCSIREKLVALVFVVMIGGFLFLSFATPDPLLLKSERRAPSKLPPITLETVASGEFMDKFNNYAADSFPFRESFRSFSSLLVFGVYMQSDKNGLYLDANGAGAFRAIYTESINQLIAKVETVAASLGDVKAYYAYIPDKSIYSIRWHPGFDPALVELALADSVSMDELVFINLAEVLNADSFYRTDLHWKQEELDGVMNVLGSAMGFESDMSGYSEEYAGKLEGVYSGQLALSIGMDDIYFRSSAFLKAAYLNERTNELEPGPVYDHNKLFGIDAYDFFLCGAQPLIILENTNAETERELYLFRDSFSSSLAPLLATGYSKVVLIDLRYIDIRTLGEYVNFKLGSDALFLYSSLVMSNPDILLVR